MLRFGGCKNLYDTLVRSGPARLSFRQFKRWRLGQALPTLEVVAMICNHTDQDLGRLAITTKDPDWGRRQGGRAKFANYGCNLTFKDRIKGGELTGNSQALSHLRAIASLGGSVSAKSNRNPRRLVSGPAGIRMFNELESEVLHRIMDAHLKVVYEPVLKVGTRRVIPDFQVGTTYIECTSDSQVRVKARRLGQKFRLLAEHYYPVKSLVVTLARLRSKYRYYLETDVDVATVEDFIRLIPEFWCGPGRI